MDQQHPGNEGRPPHQPPHQQSAYGGGTWPPAPGEVRGAVQYPAQPPAQGQSPAAPAAAPTSGQVPQAQGAATPYLTSSAGAAWAGADPRPAGPVSALAVMGKVPTSALLAAAGVFAALVVLDVLALFSVGLSTPLVVATIVAPLYTAGYVRARAGGEALARAVEHQVAAGWLWLEVSTPRSVMSPGWRTSPTTLLVRDGVLTVEGRLGPLPLHQVQLRRPSAFLNVATLQAGPTKVLLTGFTRFDVGVYMASQVNAVIVDALVRLQQASATPAPPAAPVVPVVPAAAAQPTSAAGGGAAPGWYPDPWQVAARRWYDGTAWTGYTA